MPEHLKALAVILFLATLVFAVAKAPACAAAMSAANFRRRRNLWYALTLLAFFSHGFWLYILAAGALLLVGVSAERNRLALFFALLFAVPAVPAALGGFGLVQHLFEISHVRLLSLAVLVPAFLHLATRPDRLPVGRIWPDRLLLGFLAVNFGVMLYVTTFTNVLRHGVFYAFIDVFLPYYVASRGLRDLQAFRDALMSFVVAALVLSAIGIFETAKHWMLYSALIGALEAAWDYGAYLPRGALALRAQASTGQPIALGFVIATALGLALYLRRLVPDANLRRLGVALLAGGFAAPLSRGPWLGALVMLLAYAASGPGAARQIAKPAVFALLALALASAVPGGRELIDLLPFVGSLEAENVTYRQQLLEVALAEIWRSPWFGGLDIYSLERAQGLRQHYGTFIDVVNTYVAVMLTSGLVGLTLFASFFAAVVLGVRGALKRVPDAGDERRALGRALLATLIGILAMIFTVSSITVIPTVYWCIAGVAVAYAHVLVPAGRGLRAAPAGAVRAPAGRLGAGA